MGEVDGAIAFGVLFSGAMWLVFRGTEAAPIAEEDAFVLRHARGLAVLGGLSLLAGAVIVGWSLVAFGIRSAADWWSLIGLLSFFGGIGLALIVAYRREWVRVTRDGIESQGLFVGAGADRVVRGRPRPVQWTQCVPVGRRAGRPPREGQRDDGRGGPPRGPRRASLADTRRPGGSVHFGPVTAAEGLPDSIA